MCMLTQVQVEALLTGKYCCQFGPGGCLWVWVEPSFLPILVGHVLFSEQVMAAKPLKSNTNTQKQKGNNDKVLSYSISILELTIMNHPQPSTTPPPPLVVCISQPWHVEPDSSWQSNHILNMAGFTERDRFAIINWWSVWRCSTNAEKANTMLPCESRQVFAVHTYKVASQLQEHPG